MRGKKRPSASKILKKRQERDYKMKGCEKDRNVTDYGVGNTKGNGS
jgi:hypothetical protein